MSHIHLERFDLNLLVVLRAVVAEGSVTQAALRLSLTQSAVSHALRRLRELTGDPLFLRQGAAMVPTPFTKNLDVPLRQALKTLEDSLNAAATFDPAQSSRQFAIGMDDRIEMFALPKLAEAICQAGPRLGFEVVRARAAEIGPRLRDGTLDVVVTAARVDEPGLRRLALAEDPLAVVVRAGHPVLRGPDLNMAQYLQAEHVAVEDPSNAAHDVDAVLRKAGCARRIRFRMQRYIAGIEVVARTDLLLTMPRSYASQIDFFADNRLLPLPFELPSLSYAMLWSETDETDGAGRWLRDRLLSSLRLPTPPA